VSEKFAESSRIVEQTSMMMVAASVGSRTDFGKNEESEFDFFPLNPSFPSELYPTSPMKSYEPTARIVISGFEGVID
jgi:hypothetical protein